MKWRIFLTILLAMTLIGALFFSQRSSEDIGGFKRGKMFSLGEPVSFLKASTTHIAYPCGETNSQIYFQSDLPSIIFTCDKKMSRLDTIRLKANLSFLYPRSKPFTLEIDSPSVTVFAGNVPVIIRTALYDTGAIVIPSPAKFSRAVCLGSHIYLRAIDVSRKSQQLCMLSGGQFIYRYHQTSEQDDGGLVEDGLLVADHFNNQLIYVRFFNNHIDVYDSALRQVLTFHSIDTFAGNQFTAVKFKNGYTVDKPKRIVQKWAVADKGLLYIYSGLKSDNQSAADFRNNATIDVYDYLTGKYKHTLYIPNKNGHKLNTFSVYGRKLVGVYADVVAIYLLR